MYKKNQAPLVLNIRNQLKLTSLAGLTRGSWLTKRQLYKICIVAKKKKAN